MKTATLWPTNPSIQLLGWGMWTVHAINLREKGRTKENGLSGNIPTNILIENKKIKKIKITGNIRKNWHIR